MNVSNIFTSLDSATAEVPHSSILNPFLLNSFLNDLFVFVPNSYLSNDNSLYCYGDSVNETKKKLSFCVSDGMI